MWGGGEKERDRETSAQQSEETEFPAAAICFRPSRRPAYQYFIGVFILRTSRTGGSPSVSCWTVSTRRTRTAVNSKRENATGLKKVVIYPLSHSGVKLRDNPNPALPAASLSLPSGLAIPPAFYGTSNSLLLLTPWFIPKTIKKR